MAPTLGKIIEEEISLLLFQTLKGIEEDLKEIERVETCTSASTTLGEKPSVMEEDYTVAEEALASTSHQGIIKNPCVVISAHCMNRSTFLYDARLEQQICTALCKSSKDKEERYFLEDLKGIAFQKPLKCKRCKTLRTQRGDEE